MEMKREQEIAYFPGKCSFVSRCGRSTSWKISEINDFMHFNLMVFVWWKHTATPSYLQTKRTSCSKGNQYIPFLWGHLGQSSSSDTSKERGENCRRTKKKSTLPFGMEEGTSQLNNGMGWMSVPDKNCRRGKGPNSVFFSMSLRRRIKKKEDHPAPVVCCSAQ